ncbi:hypothetical protein BD289DRAFT_42932 [Coniella lustricola]|uniref:Uncharacterized protein n=1 Tax=Coniella lustricola TaxID=2025994 RepID=A0A2T3A1U0_9PEZI|nr:hypothetical protein BD289DRAFT_42932 [Coniella lustricola]
MACYTLSMPQPDQERRHACGPASDRDHRLPSREPVHLSFSLSAPPSVSLDGPRRICPDKTDTATDTECSASKGLGPNGQDPDPVHGPAECVIVTAPIGHFIYICGPPHLSSPSPPPSPSRLSLTGVRCLFIASLSTFVSVCASLANRGPRRRQSGLDVWPAPFVNEAVFLEECLYRVLGSFGLFCFYYDGTKFAHTYTHALTYTHKHMLSPSILCSFFFCHARLWFGRFETSRSRRAHRCRCGYAPTPSHPTRTQTHTRARALSGGKQNRQGRRRLWMTSDPSPPTPCA